ncbi:MAG: type II toxin-antitoxin system RelE/ParE family toxin [Pyramidobacter sp.]|nr:type II toxin-antitoxin system RelE/ParE family toxin [Pyramidobacter sp.]MBP3751804.1 type II toxin-antitoxin system RelE/ParE family toxin [Pyramidobacter sp.]
MKFELENMIEHELIFLGNSRDELLKFPDEARREAGYQLHKVQVGLEPADLKPMTTIGLGVEEIRIREESGAFRVFYIARLDEVVYVLHAFQKKSQQTPRKDIELGQKRYRDLMKWRTQNGKR